MAKQRSSISTYKKGYTVNPTKISSLLDIDRIKQSPLYTATISGGRAWGGKANIPAVIRGIYNADTPFSISTGSEFVDTFELPQDIMNEMTLLGGQFLQNMQNRTQFIMKSVRMTEQRWNGSTSPEFSIKLDIPIVRKKDAPWQIIKYVLHATSGTLVDYERQSQVQSTDSAWQIFAPNGYRIHYSNSSKTSDTPIGAYTIELGEGSTCWFRMKQAVITAADCSISNKKYYDGNPVSVTVSISFKFWRQPLFEDIVEWFPLAGKL